MRNLVYLTILSVATTMLLILVGMGQYNTHLEVEKNLVEKATPISGRINTEFLEETFGPANEQ
jgi:hypothetical protein